MAVISACPRCATVFELPASAAPMSRLRCPACGAEFPWASSLPRGLPVAEIVMTPPASAPAPAPPALHATPEPVASAAAQQSPQVIPRHTAAETSHHGQEPLPWSLDDDDQAALRTFRRQANTGAMSALYGAVLGKPPAASAELLAPSHGIGRAAEILLEASSARSATPAASPPTPLPSFVDDEATLASWTSSPVLAPAEEAAGDFEDVDGELVLTGEPAGTALVVASTEPLLTFADDLEPTLRDLEVAGTAAASPASSSATPRKSRNVASEIARGATAAELGVPFLANPLAGRALKRRQRSLWIGVSGVALSSLVGVGLGFYGLLWLRGEQADLLGMRYWLPLRMLPDKMQQASPRRQLALLQAERQAEQEEADLAVAATAHNEEPAPSAPSAEESPSDSPPPSEASSASLDRLLASPDQSAAPPTAEENPNLDDVEPQLIPEPASDAAQFAAEEASSDSPSAADVASEESATTVQEHEASEASDVAAPAQVAAVAPPIALRTDPEVIAASHETTAAKTPVAPQPLADDSAVGASERDISSITEVKSDGSTSRPELVPATEVPARTLLLPATTTDELSAALAAAQSAGAELAQGDLRDPRAVPKMGRAYITVCHLAQCAALTPRQDGAPPPWQGDVDRVLQSLVSEPRDAVELGLIALRWWEHRERSSKGVVLIGDFSQPSTSGGWSQAVLTVSGGSKQADVTILWREPIRPVSGRAIVGGAIVNDPQADLPGYAGGDSPVVVVGSIQATEF